MDQIVDDLQYVTSQGNNREQKYRNDSNSFLTGYNNLHPCVFNPSSFCIPKFQPVFRGSYPAFSGFPVSLCRLFLLYLTYFSACESHTFVFNQIRNSLNHVSLSINSLESWDDVFADTATVISCACVFMLSHFSHVRFLVTLWTIARQVPLSMGFSRQEYWRVQPFPSPGDLPNPRIEPRSPAFADRFLAV